MGIVPFNYIYATGLERKVFSIYGINDESYGS